MKYQFKPESGAQVVEIGHGERVLRFERAAQPFEVSPEDARLLKGVDDLEPVPEDPAQQEQQSKSDEQSSQSEASTQTEEQQEETSSAERSAQPPARRRGRQTKSSE